MSEEFNLSDKINCLGAFMGVESGKQIIIHIEDVKEFIRRLKEEIKFMITANDGRYFKEQLEPKIDKLAGEKLV